MLSTKKIDDITYDNFVKQHKNGHMLQLINWAKVKSEHWYYEPIAIFNNETLVATCLLLFRKIGIGKITLCYIPKGYVGDYNDDNVLNFLIQEIKKVAKKNHAIVVDFELNSPRGEYSNILNSLETSGFKHNGHSEENFIYQTQYDMIVHFKEEISDTKEYLTKKGKSQLNKGLNSNLKLINAGKDGLSTFSKLSDETGERNSISLRNHNYYERIFDLMDSDLYLVNIEKSDLEKILIDSINTTKITKEKLEKNLQKDLSDKKRENLLKELEIQNKNIANLENDLITVKNTTTDYINLAGCLITYCGKDSYYLYAASSNDFRYLQPNIFMNYSVMKIVSNAGYKTYNLGGVKQIGDSLYSFKERLGSNLTEYEGVLSYVVNKPLYTLFKLALKLRKKLKS